MLAKDLQISEFNEEDDLRSGILLDIHCDMLAYFVNNGFPWREVTAVGGISKFIERSKRLAITFNSSIDERCRCWCYVLTNYGFKSG